MTTINSNPARGAFVSTLACPRSTLTFTLATDPCFDASLIAERTANAFDPIISRAPSTTICGVYDVSSLKAWMYCIWRNVQFRDENGSRQPPLSQ